MITDPIADMLTRIRNGYLSHKKQVDVPLSKFKLSVLDVMKKYGYIKNFRTDNEERSITVTLSYADGKPSMLHIERISKPGLRRYARLSDLKKRKEKLGYLILSTPKGVMTHIEAKNNSLGGEIICKIW